MYGCGYNLLSTSQFAVRRYALMLTRLMALRLVSRKLESIAGDLADSAKPLQEMSERHTVQLEDSYDQLLNGLSALGKRQTDLQDTCSGHLSELVKVVCTVDQLQDT